MKRILWRNVREWFVTCAVMLLMASATAIQAPTAGEFWVMMGVGGAFVIVVFAMSANWGEK